MTAHVLQVSKQITTKYLTVLCPAEAVSTKQKRTAMSSKGYRGEVQRADDSLQEIFNLVLLFGGVDRGPDGLYVD
jgi:hypothetical protein